jgi:phenylalanyl-tRNA synthetase alpha chain
MTGVAAAMTNNGATTDAAVLNGSTDGWLDEVAACSQLEQLEQLRVDLLGRKGRLTEQLKSLSTLPIDERRERGAALNQQRERLEAAIVSRKQALQNAALAERLANESIDLTLSPRPERQGRVHPISQTTAELLTIFRGLGFAVGEGSDVVDDWDNFGSLNFQPHHPARESQDSFFLQGKDANGLPTLLRTQTSSAQIKLMRQFGAPLAMVVPGKVYRQDSDATHSPMFHQLEGFVIDRGISFAHLKGCLQAVLTRFFGIPDLPMRFRPHYFPFTEPSAEVDIAWSRSKGRIDRDGDKWLEILGAGMIHPTVLRNGGIDPNEYQGFAFGMGLDRLTMLKYGIKDLRPFFEGDLRWLGHYGFSPFGVGS